MFPHTITIFGKQKDDKSYPRYVIEGVLWYGSETMVIAGKGLQNNDSINIVIPKDSLEKSSLSRDFKVQKGYRVVKGIVDNIQSSIIELNKYENCITVSSVGDYDFSSDLDCILVGGK